MGKFGGVLIFPIITVCANMVDFDGPNPTLKDCCDLQKSAVYAPSDHTQGQFAR